MAIAAVVPVDCMTEGCSYNPSFQKATQSERHKRGQAYVHSNTGPGGPSLRSRRIDSKQRVVSGRGEVSSVALEKSTCAFR